ncbi:D-beta-hydroxybutyrate dehydrogenase, mitochondrial-like [Panulirus ornatus]|uniref:D-beta-hydroxybutyrate dehydrogenase, mitochondrial-like n=1 Tax=Panulirus ornatus TaxID=150431 RepID=UPI003A843042
MLWTLDKVVRVVSLGGVSALLATLLSALGIVSCLLAFPALWLLTAAAYLYRANLKVSAYGKAVVVTGCDSGFGNILALHLDKMGFRVFAGCLKADSEGADHLRQEGSSRLHVLQMDVTNQDQLDKAAQHVKHLLPDGESVWGLVNNAGVCTLGPVEWVSMKGFRKDPEVNVFGLIASTKTFLPFVRRARGRIVNISSMAGRSSKGFMSAYSISKFAVEAFSDALRQEMRDFGVKVCLIEPGNFGAGTNLYLKDAIMEKEVEVMWASLGDNLRSDYGETYRRKVQEMMTVFRKTGATDVSPVIKAITEALTQTHPQPRYCPATFKRLLSVYVRENMPEWVFDSLTSP